MRLKPTIRDGCEDPTLAIDGDTYVVYYSVWNQQRGAGQLLGATGPAPNRLEKRGIVIASQAGRENPKEATIVRAGDGSWRLFFGYASGGASRVGLAEAPAIDGPWRQLADPFSARDWAFDHRHLSPGPIVGTQRPVMFYNGANAETHWRIGWIAFDASFTRVAGRCPTRLSCHRRGCPARPILPSSLLLSMAAKRSRSTITSPISIRIARSCGHGTKTKRFLTY